MQQIGSIKGISTFTENFSGVEIRYYSKPGLPDWDCVSPSQRLIVENITLEPGSSTLMLGNGNGVEILTLAVRFPKAQITISNNNGIALELLNKSINENAIHNLAISMELSHYPEKVETFDNVIIDLPKGRKLSRRWLLEAYLILKPNGVLFLSGANDQGIQSVTHDGTDLFFHHSVFALKQGNRLLRFREKKPQTAQVSWSYTPGILPGTWMEFNTTIRGHPYHFKTLPGVFASERLDPGTAFLLEHLEFKEQGRILDFGCGCGIVGAVIAKNSRAWVDMTDIDRYAIAAATENIKELRLANCKVFFSDGLEGVMDRVYDQIVTNPPFHSGKAIDYSMTHSLITRSFSVLTGGGELCLVANKFIRYDKILKNYFSEFNALVSNQQFTIWKARKP